MHIYMTIYIYIGEGNANPLQYSCLENPKDRGAWQATAHGVARVGYIYMPSLLSLSPLPPAYSSRSSQSSRMGSPCYVATSHCLFYTWWGIYVNAISQFIPSSPSPAESTSLFISTIFYTPYVCINIWHLFFSFWLQSVWRIGPDIAPFIDWSLIF